MTASLLPPPPLEVVSPEAVATRITATQQELAALGAEVAAVRAEADALEAELGEPFDADAYAFVSIRLRRFLDDLRAEANAEMDTLLAVGAARNRRHRPTVTFAHLVTRDGVATPTAAPAPARPLADPVTAPAPAPAPHPVVPAPSPIDRVGAPEPVAVGAEPTAVPAAPLALHAPVVVPAVAMDPGLESEPDLEAAFWSDGDASAPHRHVLRAARAVGLQAAAVVLVLTAVLIRIG